MATIHLARALGRIVSILWGVEAQAFVCPFRPLADNGFTRYRSGESSMLMPASLAYASLPPYIVRGDSPMAAIARRLESQFRLPTAPLPVLVPPLRPVDSGLSEAVKALKKEHRLATGSELIDILERRRRNQVVPTTLESVDALLDGGL